MRKWIVGGLLALSMGVMSTSAEAAAIRMVITSTTCSVFCAPIEIVGVGNEVQFVGSFGDVSLNISAGISNNPGDSPTYLAQTSVTANSLSDDSENLNIIVSQTDFMLPVGAAALGSATGITANSAPGVTSATFASAYASSNLIYDTSEVTTAPLVCSGGGVIPPFACSDSSSVLLIAAAPFSLTNVFFLDLAPNASGTFGGQTTLTAVPEPASMALFGLGALGLGILRRKR